MLVRVEVLIDEQSKPPSDKLGGEICISSPTLACLSLYMESYGLTTNTVTTRIVCILSHLKAGSYIPRRDQKSLFFRCVSHVDRIQPSSIPCLTLKFSLY